MDQSWSRVSTRIGIINSNTKTGRKPKFDLNWWNFSFSSFFLTTYRRSASLIQQSVCSSRVGWWISEVCADRVILKHLYIETTVQKSMTTPKIEKYFKFYNFLKCWLVYEKITFFWSFSNVISLMNIDSWEKSFCTVVAIYKCFNMTRSANTSEIHQPTLIIYICKCFLFQRN